MGLFQVPQIFEFTPTSESRTRISDIMGSAHRRGKRYTEFIVRVKDPADSSLFYVGGSDVTTSNRKGFPGSGDAGNYGAVIETMNYPMPEYQGLSLTDYYLAHAANKTYVLIVY